MSGKEMSGVASEPHAPCIVEGGRAETSLAVVEVLTVWSVDSEAFRLARYCLDAASRRDEKIRFLC
jgi:hypothetical protein